MGILVNQVSTEIIAVNQTISKSTNKRGRLKSPYNRSVIANEVKQSNENHWIASVVSPSQ
jgi:hypothetical protein